MKKGVLLMKPLASRLPLVAESYLGVSYDQMDCQKFVETCLKDVGIALDLPGSNAWYRKMTWVGTPEACVDKFGLVPDGAFLFILEQDGKEPEKYKVDGIGNASHIGLCTGRRGMGAIHSSKSKGCVVQSQFSGKTVKNRGWNRVGLWDALSYGEKADGILNGNSLPADAGSSEESKGTGGGSVIDWQEMEVRSGNGGPVNFRKQPSVNSPLIASVPVGTLVSAGPAENDWRPVKYRNRSGWMMALYLKDPKPALETVPVPRAELESLYDMIGAWLYQGRQ